MMPNSNLFEDLPDLLDRESLDDTPMDIPLATAEDRRGHRQRRRSFFLKNGCDHWEDYEILEFLLFFAIPQRDVKPLAKLLIKTYGSFAAVLDAPTAELLRIRGCSENTVALMKSIPASIRRYHLNKRKRLDRLLTADDRKLFVIPYFARLTFEQVLLVCLDNNNTVLHSAPVADGTVNAASLSSRQVVETAMLHRASKVILAHNHPFGPINPSAADLIVTKKMQSVLQPLQVELLDHIIVYEDEAISLLEANMFR